MGDWSKPALDGSDAHLDVLDYLNDRLNDAATMFASAPSNQPDTSIRWNNSTTIFERYSSGGAAWSAILLAVAGGGTGASTASGARTNLGLGTISTQNANNVAITGGAISGVTFTSITVDAASITSGTLPDARLSSNVAMRNAANTFTANCDFTSTYFFRVQSSNNPSSGSGIELYVSGGTCYIQGYNRTGTAYLPLSIRGLSIAFNVKLTADISGNCDGSSGSCTGNAATATYADTAGAAPFGNTGITLSTTTSPDYPVVYSVANQCFYQRQDCLNASQQVVTDITLNPDGTVASFTTASLAFAYGLCTGVS